MAQYHVSEDGPRVCKTTPDRCPYGRKGEPHFDNINDATDHYGETMESKYGTLSTVTIAKYQKSAQYAVYSLMEKLESDSPESAKIAEIKSFLASGERRQNPAAANLGDRSGLRRKMRASGFTGVISKISTRNGAEHFKPVAVTPETITKFQAHLTKEREPIAA